MLSGLGRVAHLNGSLSGWAGFFLGRGIITLKSLLHDRLTFVTKLCAHVYFVRVRQSARSTPCLGAWLLGPILTGTPSFQHACDHSKSLGVSLHWVCLGTQCLPCISGRQMLREYLPWGGPGRRRGVLSIWDVVVGGGKEGYKGVFWVKV